MAELETFKDRNLVFFFCKDSFCNITIMNKSSVICIKLMKNKIITSLKEILRKKYFYYFLINKNKTHDNEEIISIIQ